MSEFLVLAFLFCVGSVAGWAAELIFRRFFSSANPERRWITPGFCTGPWVPLYGMGLCCMYLIVSLEKYSVFESLFWTRAALFLAGAAAMTGIEYVAGVVSLKVLHVRLWDYSAQWGNVQGIICPKFSALWAALVAAYYFLIHPHILDALAWLSRNLAFSFFIGLFFGVFIIDAVNSAQLMTKLRAYAVEHDYVVRYELLKQRVRAYQDASHERARFFRPFRSGRPLSEHLRDMLAESEKQRETLNNPSRRRNPQGRAD